MQGLSGRAVTELSLFGAGVGAILIVVSGTMWLRSRFRGRSLPSDNGKWKRPGLFMVAIGLFVVCFSIALVANRLTRDAERQPPLLSRAGLRFLFNPITQTAGQAQERVWLSDLASLRPIDAHTHIARTDPALVEMLKRLHMHVLDILYVDDTTPYRSSLERQKRDALNFIASSNGQATLCTTFDPFSSTGFPKKRRTV